MLFVRGTVPTLVLFSSVFPHRHVDRLNICMSHTFSLRMHGQFARRNVGLNLYVNLWVLLFDSEKEKDEAGY